MEQRKIFIFLLIGYFITQLLSLYFGFLLFFYSALYFLSIIIGLVWLKRNFEINKDFKPLKTIIIISFIVNLILSLIYLKVLYFNPKINWTIENGGFEQDPMLLLTYFPSVFFLFSSGVFIIEVLYLKFIKHTKK